MKGICTKFVCTCSVNASAPCPFAGSSGAGASSFCTAVEDGSEVPGPSVSEVDCAVSESSGVAPIPGVTPCTGNVCALGASGIACCCAALWADNCRTGWPISNIAKAPANTLILTKQNPHRSVFMTEPFLQKQYQLPDYQRDLRAAIPQPSFLWTPSSSRMLCRREPCRFPHFFN